MPDWNSHTNPDCNGNGYVYSNAYGYGDRDSNSNRNANSDGYGYGNTGADHAARAWLQSARPANGRPLLEWADLGFHRHLSQRRVDCHRAEPRWFLYRSHQPQWEGNLYVWSMRSGDWELLQPGHGDVWRWT